MSDIRTRIAWSLYRATQQQDAYVEDIEEYPGEPLIDADTVVDGRIVFTDLADAVIRELNLREERRYPNRLPHYTFMPPQRTRYVTEWES